MRSDQITKGLQRSPHRSLLKATGLTDTDIRKPFIAVVNSYTDVVPGHVHLDAVGELVAAHIRAAGGTPFVFNTIAICDGLAMGHTGMKYSLASRELIADSVQAMCEAHQFDAMVCIPNCDKITPGMLMASLRLNIPTIFVSGGPMEAGHVDGKDVDLIDQFTAVAQQTVGKMSAAKVRQYENNTCPTCGSCSGLFTANSMNCLCEAIGIALPGNGTCLATSEARTQLYITAAQRIVAMTKQWARGGCKKTFDLLPRRIMSRKAFANAFAVDMAMGGSSNTVLHLLAMASEAGINFTLKDIDRISKRTPNICRVAPSPTPEGKIYHMQDVHRAGGVHTIMWQLATDKPTTMHTDCKTVTGKTVGQNLSAWSLRSKRVSPAVKKFYRDGATRTGRSIGGVRMMLLAEMVDESGQPLHDADIRKILLGKPTVSPQRAGRANPKDVIRPVDKAFTRRGGLLALYGNIATSGAIMKLAGLAPEMYRFTGRARIFESQEDACEGILGGKVRAGDVVVIRNEGPRGGPGMQEMLAPSSYMKGMGLYDKCYMITDGRYSGGTSGPCIGHVAPEAAGGGEIGLLRNGDVIEIDALGGTLAAKVSAAEFARRRKRYKPRRPQIRHGMLGRYAAHATSADTGAILVWPGKND
ncbi:MAG: dihydroxy-acid dehydratase [Planctomycetota bacterium]|jgi:dihydroxy-acid dehydratase